MLCEQRNSMLAWCRLFCKKVLMPTEAVTELNNYLYENAEEAAVYLAAHRELHDLDNMKKMLVTRDGDIAYLKLLAFSVLRSEQTLADYRARGLSENVFWASMKDISIWCGNYMEESGKPGLKDFTWIGLFLKPEIFTLGRLQFQVCDLQKPGWVKEEELESVGLKCGDPVLSVHIPQGRPLNKEECLQSFELAKEFFHTYDFKMFVCQSWLIYPRNREYMRPGVNILDFETLFEVISTCDDSHLAIERIWNFWSGIPSDITGYAENTSLQRDAKQYLLSGGKLGEGFGVRRK